MSSTHPSAALLLPCLPRAAPAPSGPRWAGVGEGVQKERVSDGEDGSGTKEPGSGDAPRGPDGGRAGSRSAARGCGLGRGEARGGRGAPKRQERGRCSEVQTENKKPPGEMTYSRPTPVPLATRGAGSGRGSRRCGPPRAGDWEGNSAPPTWSGSGPAAPAAAAPRSVEIPRRPPAAVSFYFIRFLNLEAGPSAISFKTDIQPSEWRAQPRQDLAFPSFLFPLLQIIQLGEMADPRPGARGIRVGEPGADAAEARRSAPSGESGDGR